LSESLENFSVAVVATDDGRFGYQVFLVCGEPRTLLTDREDSGTHHDARGPDGQQFGPPQGSRTGTLWPTPDGARMLGVPSAASAWRGPVPG
jgi:hypothetical protein